MMPVYYDPSPIAASDIELAKQSWVHIRDNLSQVFLDKQSIDMEFSKKYSTCIDWFVSTFFGRLFDVHPVIQ